MPVLKYKDPNTGEWVSFAQTVPGPPGPPGSLGGPAGGDLSGTYPNPSVIDANIDHGSISGLTDDDHPQYMKGAAPVATGIIEAQAGINSSGLISSAVARITSDLRSVLFRLVNAANLNRFQWYLFTAESGSNAGSDLILGRFADDGSTYLGSPIAVNRSSGQVTFENPVYLQTPTPTLANHATSKQYVDTYTSVASLSYTAPFMDYGSGYATLITKSGGMVTIEGVMKPSSNQTWVTGTGYNIGTIPVGFRPAQWVGTVGFAQVGGVDALCRIDVISNTTLRVVPFSGGAFNTTGWLVFSFTYRQGN